MIGRSLRIADWLAYVASYDFGRVPPVRVVLHHTQIPTVAQWRGLASMRGMQTFYGRKGWTAAPHIYVGPEAGPNVWLMTPMDRVGIHANAGNSGIWNGRWGYSIGVEMVGNYDEERPSGMVWDGTLAVLGGLSLRLGIAPRQLISFHRIYNRQKSCPGWAVKEEWVWGEAESWLRDHQTLPDATPALCSETYAVRSVAIARDEPNKTSAIVGRLTKPATVEIVGSTNRGQQVDNSTTWYITQAGDYIHSSALRKVE